MNNLELVNKYFCNNEGNVENGILHHVIDDCGVLSATYKYMVEDDNILESHCGHGSGCFATGWECCGDMQELIAYDNTLEGR